MKIKVSESLVDRYRRLGGTCCSVCESLVMVTTDGLLRENINQNLGYHVTITYWCNSCVFLCIYGVCPVSANKWCLIFHWRYVTAEAENLTKRSSCVLCYGDCHRTLKIDSNDVLMMTNRPTSLHNTSRLLKYEIFLDNSSGWQSLWNFLICPMSM